MRNKNNNNNNSNNNNNNNNKNNIYINNINANDSTEAMENSSAWSNSIMIGLIGLYSHIVVQ